MPNTITGSQVHHTSLVLPSPGELADAATVDAPFQGLLDNDAYILARIPPAGYYLVTVFPSLVFVPGSGWGQVTAYAHTTATSTGPVEQTSIAALAGDIIEVSAVVNTVNSNVSLGATYLDLEYAENFPGGTGVTTTQFIQAEARSQYTGASAWVAPVAVNGVRQVVTPGTFAIFLNGKATAAGSQSDWVPVSGSLIVKQWRPFP